MKTLEYEIAYSELDVQKLINEKRLFDLAMMAAYIKGYKKGFKVKNISKTHKNGTKLTYIKINNNDELDEYKEFLIEMIREYNNKYGEKITMDEIS
jgi:hypothetical protein